MFAQKYTSFGIYAKYINTRNSYEYLFHRSIYWNDSYRLWLAVGVLSGSRVYTFNYNWPEHRCWNGLSPRLPESLRARLNTLIIFIFLSCRSSLCRKVSGRKTSLWPLNLNRRKHIFIRSWTTHESVKKIEPVANPWVKYLLWNVNIINLCRRHVETIRARPTVQL